MHVNSKKYETKLVATEKEVFIYGKKLKKFSKTGELIPMTNKQSRYESFPCVCLRRSLIICTKEQIEEINIEVAKILSISTEEYEKIVTKILKMSE